VRCTYIHTRIYRQADRWHYKIFLFRINCQNLETDFVHDSNTFSYYVYEKVKSSLGFDRWMSSLQPATLLTELSWLLLKYYTLVLQNSSANCTAMKTTQKHRYQNPLYIVLSTDVMWTTVHTWKFEREVWAVTFISLALSDTLTADVPTVWVLKEDGSFPCLTYQSCELSLLPSPNFSTRSDSTNSNYRGEISNLDLSRIRASVKHNKISGHKSRACIYCCNMPFQQFCFSYHAITIWRRILEYRLAR
jgi:hypothetical protein